MRKLRRPTYTGGRKIYAGGGTRGSHIPGSVPPPPPSPEPVTHTLYATAQSGEIDSLAAAYEDARAGSGSKAMYKGVDIYLGQYLSGGPSYGVEMGMLEFDTSGVDGTITSAVLSLGLKSDGTPSVDFIVQARSRDWGVTSEAADWVPGDELAALTLLATLDTSGMGAIGEYKNMVESGSALRSAINQNGFTRMILTSDRIVDSIPPEETQLLVLHPYNHETLKPKLVVVSE